MTLDDWQDTFRAHASTDNAKGYADSLIQYYGDGMIGPDTLREGLIELASVMTESRNALGWPVVIKVELA